MGVGGEDRGRGTERGRGGRERKREREDGRERGKEREGQGERDRQRQRQTDTDKQTERYPTKNCNKIMIQLVQSWKSIGESLISQSATVPAIQKRTDTSGGKQN